jgi:hypothetical protein
MVMSLRWRWSLVVVLAAVVLGGFMPQSLLSDAHAAPGQATIARAGPPTFPSGCTGTSCSKSAPVAPVPVLTIAGLAGLAAVILKAPGAGFSRRMRTFASRLPSGAVTSLFHPPQFSAPALLAA